MEAKRSFTILEDGTVKIPAELLQKYGLKSGDEVEIIEIKNGLLIGGREQLIDQMLNQMGASIREKYDGLSEEEIIETFMQRGRDKIRPQLLKELYGIDSEND